MDRPNRNSEGNEPPQPPNNPNVFDDDYEIEPDEDDFMPSVSDGFRPANASQAWSGDRQNHDRQDAMQRHTSTSKTHDSNHLRRTATRNSTAKVREPAAADARPPAQPSPHRASVSSTGSFATTSNGENPFETGPSHPYAMYPQHTMARSSSVATASTEQQPHRSMSPQRPTHPYAMYSQSGLDAGIGEQLPVEPAHPQLPPVQTAIPIGFPGLSDGYHRVLVSPLSSPSFSAAALPSVPLLPSVTPARLPPQRPETQTGSTAPVVSSYAMANQIPAEPTESSSASLLTTEQGYSEKVEAEEPKMPWYQKKLWGRIPVGVALGILGLILILAIALGAGIGALATKKHQDNKNKTEHERPKESPQPQVTGSHGSLFDATPIPTPPGLGSIPTGAFSLPLGIPMESNPGCLTQANQYSAWSCKLTFAPLVVTINNTETRDGPLQVASMKTGAQVPDGTILYGLQPPNLALKPLQLVLDLDYKAYGPAYHFQDTYDKLVILRPDELSSNARFSKRQDSFRQRFQVKPGDLPWYCFWNSTYIEGYIYAEDNSTAASLTSMPTQAPSGSLSASYDTAGFPITTAGIAATGSATVSPASVTATASPVSKRDANSDASAPPRMPPYPRIVKIEERRLPNSPQPYCQQMILLDDGKITPATSSNDVPKKIWLQESDPTYEDYFAAQTTGTSNKRRDASPQRRSDPSDACHCQWMFK
ncbi:hypothetical protein DE146DRAFT_612395 [Phaeosphaeria sp. MPI-PUGE-AT-0046c]|nr:hypothetical protein DE146DRAFT_612395 [Phaeosphaeria sp. MPI-PUGE-AT-0046c]